MSMKTKILSIILGLCAILAISSCEKEARISDGDADFVIRLAFDGSFTRTTGSVTVEDAEEESTISSLRLFLIKADDTDEIVELSSSEYSYDSATRHIAVTLRHTYAGSWRVVVIANCPSSVTIDTADYDSFCAAYSGISTSVLASEDSFLMVTAHNDTDPVGVLVENLTGLGDSVDNPREVDVTLERVVSKVTVNVSPYITNNLIGTIFNGSDANYGVIETEFMGYALVNEVNSFNLFQQWDSEGNLVTPSSSSSYDLSTGYVNPLAASMSLNDFGTRLYCLENNSPEYTAAGGTHKDATIGTKMKARVTGVLICVQVKSVSSFSSEAETDGGEDSSESLVLDPNEGIWTKAAPDYTFYRYNGVFYKDKDILLERNSSLVDGSADELRAQGVMVYVDGNMYYLHWLCTDGEYCVARNVFYNLLVNQISSFGEDVPGGYTYSGTDPIQKDNALISLGLEIVDWDEKTAQDYIIQ